MIHAILLAAGRSRRMGTQKLLLPYAGSTVIAHIVDQLLASAVDGVTVVVSDAGGPVAAQLASRPIRIAVNPAAEADMLSSVRCGLRALPACDGHLIALGDQPSVTSALVDEMIEAFSAGGKGIVAPVYDGRRGHPVMFADRYRDEVLANHDGMGLRGLLHAHPGDVLELAASTSAVLSDMDYPDDYRRELARLDECWPDSGA